MPKGHVLGWQILLLFSAHPQGARGWVGQGQGKRTASPRACPSLASRYPAKQLETGHFPWPLASDLAALASLFAFHLESDRGFWKTLKPVSKGPRPCFVTFQTHPCYCEQPCQQSSQDWPQRGLPLGSVLQAGAVTSASPSIPSFIHSCTQFQNMEPPLIQGPALH